MADRLEWLRLPGVCGRLPGIQDSLKLDVKHITSMCLLFWEEGPRFS